MITTILLAAGSSHRFGSDKLLTPLDDGRALIETTASSLITADCRVLAVVRPGGGKVASLLAELPGVRVTECPDADLGMGRSLAWGVSESADSSGWLVALADMPFLRPSSIRAVVTRLEQGASIASPCFDGRQGHPVGFASRWRNNLLALSGDQGGKTILRGHPQSIECVPCDDPGVLQDVDLPSDIPVYQRDQTRLP